MSERKGNILWKIQGERDRPGPQFGRAGSLGAEGALNFKAPLSPEEILNKFIELERNAQDKLAQDIAKATVDSAKRIASREVEGDLITE